jgi:CubicO group peptidase (beta-lactamase class C family)
MKDVYRSLVEWFAVGLCFVATAHSQTQRPPAPQPTVNSGEPRTTGPDLIQAFLQPLVTDHTIAGAVTLIASKDSIVYLKPVGYRDIASKSPMPADALFWIASTSKPMTATAVMMLVDEGKISLDDPVEKYLPEFKGQMVKETNPPSPIGTQEATVSQATSQLVPAIHPILVREILSHTSGLPFRSAAQPGALDLLPLKDAVKSFVSEPLLFQPGTNYSYSNEGLNTAARIIEVVTGMPYEQFMQERLFTPLGMKDTTFWPAPEQIGRLAKSYHLDSHTKDLAEIQIDQLTYPLDDRQHRYPMPAGGLFSTAADISIFCRMILNGGVLDGKRYLSQASLQLMTTEQNHGLGKTSYGFGWSISANGFGHGGAYRNVMEIDPSKNRILIFMVQQNGAWGTADGDSMVIGLERLADELVNFQSKDRAPAGSGEPK